jgi:hypothetical protein
VLKLKAVVDHILFFFSIFLEKSVEPFRNVTLIILPEDFIHLVVGLLIPRHSALVLQLFNILLRVVSAAAEVLDANPARLPR